MIAPILMAITMGITEYGMQTYSSMSVEGAARSAMQSLAVNPGNTAGAQNAALAATTLDASKMTVNVTQQCKCADASIVSCSGTCPNAVDVETWYKIEVNTLYSRMFSIPGLEDEVTLTGHAELRVK